MKQHVFCTQIACLHPQNDTLQVLTYIVMLVTMYVMNVTIYVSTPIFMLYEAKNTAFRDEKHIFLEQKIIVYFITH